MSGFVKLAIGIAVIASAGLLAKILPVSTAIPQTAQRSAVQEHSILDVPSVKGALPSKPARSLFSNHEGTQTLPVLEPADTVQIDWSPFAYELIGVSRVGTSKTAWLKHKDSGDLVSARQGAAFGAWTVKRISDIDISLSGEERDTILKLFQGEKPR